MATEIKVWEINKGHLSPVKDSAFADTYPEKDLEDWIAENPDICGEDLLVIDRQRDVPDVGRLDLLCIDSTGRVVILELKRDESPREAVAQALDYASWLDGISEDQLHEYASNFLKRPLAEVFFERFQKKPPAIAPQNHRIILVASRLDSAAERIINYLSGRHGVDINAIFFKYVKLNSGQEIMVRSVLVTDELRKTRSSSGYTRTPEELLSIAAQNKTTHIVEICRRMGTIWDEQGTASYGGAFRYWTQPAANKWKMMFGVNVAGERLHPPSGQLDVWIPTASMSEVTGIKEEIIRQKLKSEHPLEAAQPTDCIVRLKDAVQAEKLVAQLKVWATSGKEEAALHAKS